MKETSFKAGVIGGLCGVFTFLALFATTSKASINEPDDIDDLSKEAYQEMYLKETNPIICESDDEFINMCKQIKGK